MKPKTPNAAYFNLKTERISVDLGLSVDQTLEQNYKKRPSNKGSMASSEHTNGINFKSAPKTPMSGRNSNQPPQQDMKSMKIFSFQQSKQSKSKQCSQSPRGHIYEELMMEPKIISNGRNKK